MGVGVVFCVSAGVAYCAYKCRDRCGRYRVRKEEERHDIELNPFAGIYQITTSDFDPTVHISNEHHGVKSDRRTANGPPHGVKSDRRTANGPPPPYEAWPNISNADSDTQKNIQTHSIQQTASKANIHPNASNSNIQPIASNTEIQPTESTTSIQPTVSNMDIQPTMSQTNVMQVTESTEIKSDKAQTSSVDLELSRFEDQQQFEYKNDDKNVHHRADRPSTTSATELISADTDCDEGISDEGICVDNDSSNNVRTISTTSQDPNGYCREYSTGDKSRLIG